MHWGMGQRSSAGDWSSWERAHCKWQSEQARHPHEVRINSSHRRFSKQISHTSILYSLLYQSQSEAAFGDSQIAYCRTEKGGFVHLHRVSVLILLAIQQDIDI